MYQIKTLNHIAKIGLSQFPNNYHVDSAIDHPDAIILRSYQMHDMLIPDSVKVIGRAGAGTNNIPVALLTKRGIPVLNTPGANANAVCELVVAGMLLASRNLCDAWDYVRQLKGDDESISKQIEEDKKKFAGFELAGKTLGVIGLGSIGTKVANTALGLGMKVIGYDPSITVKRAWELSSNVQNAQNLETLLQHSDFISIHVPLVNDTRQLINAKRLQYIKKNAVLLNFSRDEIINQEDVLAALNEARMARYVCDFPSQLFQNHPAVISLPHLGASTTEAEENCAVMIVKQIREFLEFGAITNAVNFPQVEASMYFDKTRLAIVNANVPNMVAQISEELAKANLNIVSLTNKSKDEIAYTLIDVDADVSSELMQNIKNINGVLAARKLVPQNK